MGVSFSKMGVDFLKMGVSFSKMGVGFSKIRVRFKNGSVCKCNVTCRRTWFLYPKCS